MEIKYEAVFGLQELFFKGSPHVYAIHADGLKTGDVNESEERFFKDGEGDLFYFAISDLRLKYHRVIFAMRRIIRTPTWTKEDQKAGKLPDVGCRVFVSPTCTATVTAIDAIQKVVAVQCENQALDILSIYEMLPIESPEEKAARLRDEWVEKAVGATPVYEIAAHGYSTQLRIDISSIYDAMISGDLPVPVKGE